jgi:hypothetical protein
MSESELVCELSFAEWTSEQTNATDDFSGTPEQTKSKRSGDLFSLSRCLLRSAGQSASMHGVTASLFVFADLVRRKNVAHEEVSTEVHETYLCL